MLESGQENKAHTFIVTNKQIIISLGSLMTRNGEDLSYVISKSLNAPGYSLGSFLYAIFIFSWKLLT